jgi:hypothetical protein
MSKKFTEKDIGSFVKDFYSKYKSDPSQAFFFDFSEYEWISNQNLLLISSLIKYLYNSNANFKIRLFQTKINAINKKQARTIVELWEVWKLYEIFENNNFENYIEKFENSTIPYLKKKYNINVNNNVYNRLGITPFVALNVINNYKDEELLETEIEPIFNLEEAILNELSSENSDHPFLEQTLSSIITRELYENFLDHYQSTFFNTSKDMSFMSIALKRKLRIDKYYVKRTFLSNFIQDYYDKLPTLCKYILAVIERTDDFVITIDIERINELIHNDIANGKLAQTIIKTYSKEDFNTKQSLLEKSFSEEELEESKRFFKDSKFANESYIQYTFIDYGKGIPATILDEYCKENDIIKIDIFNQPNDNDLLKFAFKHYTSRFPITDKFGNTDKIIPRGLFDILTIAQRYHGLLIIRSNSGRILYNFKTTSDFEEAISVFGKQEDFFPGTYITLYIPELSNIELFDKSAIRYVKKDNQKKGRPRNINLFNLIGSEFIPKKELYNILISKLNSKLSNNQTLSRLNYINFFGIKDNRIIKKTLYFLLTNYEINQNNSVLIMHPPEITIINAIIEEIRALNATIKNFKIHPIPLIRYLPSENDISLDWLGVYNKEDKTKLNDLLFEQYSLSLSDFIEPANVKGNVITTDKYGNVNGLLPNREILTRYYQLYTTNLVNEAIQSNELLKSNGLYLCTGNYYQNEFLQMSELLDNSIYRDVLASALYEQILIAVIRDKNITKENAKRYLHSSKQTQFKGKDKELKYIAVTSSSHKILKSFFQQGYIYKNNANENSKDAPYIKFDNYLDIETSEKIEFLGDNTEYIILCDAISTGNLVNRLNDLIQGKDNSELLYVATFVSNLDLEFENTNEFAEDYSLKLISLLDLPIKKYRVNDLKDEDFKKSLIRINPFTNLPIEFNEDSSLNESILIKDNLEFLGYLEEKDINIRFEIHNNLIHPYYFNIGSILEKENLKIKGNQLTESLVYNVFVEKKKFDFTNGDCVVFYPKYSGVDFLNKNEFNSKITANHTVRFYELERFPTESGWKFPHSSTYFQEVIDATPNVLIIDDGTCSGNSLYQMINEISHFEPKKIDLLCIVSRIDDYKREFLSRLKRLRKHTKSNEEIDVNIYYGAQWHIPTFYQNENPYSDEIKWLNQILELRNTPLFIRKNASKILETINPNTKKKCDYKYFPKDRQTKEIPKKDILLTRNEIGKIAGYRFYKESFKWYNDITFKKRKKSFTDKTENRQIELLSMCLLYEPYLYPIISNSFPDIRLHLEQFVKNIFFEIDGKRINLETDLFYDWTGNKKDLIHLFFIVYKDNNLYSFIQKHDNLLESFLLFAGDNDRALNYILYKLSFYFPVNGNSRKKPPQIVKNSIQKLLSQYPSTPEANINFVEKVKRFNHFTTSLVSSDEDDSFENSKSKIENYFNQINNPDYHKVGLNNDKSLILAHFRDIVKCIDENQDYEDHLILLKDKLFENLYPYVNQILSFSKTYREFLIVDDDYNKLNASDNSLRGLLSVLDEIVLDNTKIQFKDGREIILRIYSKFFDEKFFLYKTLNTQSTKGIISLIKSSIDNYTSNRSSFSLETNIDSMDGELCISMPLRYTKLIIEEIVNNFRHSTEAKLTLRIDKEYLFVEITSKKTTIKSSGTNSGFTLFQNLQNNQLLNCDCSIGQSDSNFHQVLKFKIL